MDIISTVMLGITAFFLVFGLLYGLKRGAVRSIVRLITLGVAFAAAWFGKALYVDAVLTMEINGVSLSKSLSESLGEGSAMAGVIEPLVEILLGVVLFVLAFIALKIVTAIIFFVIGFFLPKGKKGVGMLIGLVQGALIAFCICAPLNGVVLDMQKLMNIEMDGQPVIDAETKASMQDAGVDLDAYAEGPVSKLYTAIGKGFYNALAKTENADGNTVTLSGYVDATVATTKFADELVVLSGINFENGLTAENRDAIHQSFKNLDQIKGEMSEEAKATVNQMIAAVVADAGEEIPPEMSEILENFDISAVNFEKEGEVILDLYEYAEGEGEVTATELVNTLAESTLILPAIESMVETESAIELPDDETRAEITAAINALENDDAAASLRKIFGLS